VTLQREETAQVVGIVIFAFILICAGSFIWFALNSLYKFLECVHLKVVAKIFANAASTERCTRFSQDKNMKFLAITSTADQRLVKGKIYTGQIVMNATNDIRIVVFDDTGAWMSFNSNAFMPAEIV